MPPIGKKGSTGRRRLAHIGQPHGPTSRLGGRGLQPAPPDVIAGRSANGGLEAAPGGWCCARNQAVAAEQGAGRWPGAGPPGRGGPNRPPRPGQIDPVVDDEQAPMAGQSWPQGAGLDSGAVGPRPAWRGTAPDRPRLRAAANRGLSSLPQRRIRWIGDQIQLLALRVAAALFRRCSAASRSASSRRGHSAGWRPRASTGSLLRRRIPPAPGRAFPAPGRIGAHHLLWAWRSCWRGCARPAPPSLALLAGAFVAGAVAATQPLAHVLACGAQILAIQAERHQSSITRRPLAGPRFEGWRRSSRRNRWLSFPGKGSDRVASRAGIRAGIWVALRCERLTRAKLVPRCS